jgi:hypothetical protein
MADERPYGTRIMRLPSHPGILPRPAFAYSTSTNKQGEVFEGRNAFWCALRTLHSYGINVLFPAE